MPKTIIVAVDETQLVNFQSLVDSLDSDLCMIKVGSVSFNALGHQAISYASNKGFKIFLDLKLHENIIRSLASFQLSINNLLELITKIKEIPSTFSHSEMLKNELEEIKKYKEDTF